MASNFRANRAGTVIRAGIQTEADVNVPVSAPSSTYSLVDSDSASTWCVILFLGALVMLYIVL